MSGLLPRNLHVIKGKTKYLLLANSRLLNELLAKDDSLVAPFEALFNDSAGLSDHSARHHESLMIEIRH